MKNKMKSLWGKLRKNIKTTTFKRGGYSAAATGILLAVLVIVNLIVSALPADWISHDISSQKLYSIGDTTKEVLDAMTGDVTIYVLAAKGEEDEGIMQMLNRYADASDHITIETLDPTYSPSFLTQYEVPTDVTASSLVVVSDQRYKYIPYDDIYETSYDYSSYYYTGSYTTTSSYDGEGEVTSAIDYVLSDNIPKIYVLEGHDETELDDTFTEGITKNNFEYETLNLFTNPEIPDDCATLLINGPTSDLSEEEATLILDYLKNGGDALISLAYTEADMPNFNSVLEYYGLAVEPGVIFEGSSSYYSQYPYYVISYLNEDSDITSSIDSNTLSYASYLQGISYLDTVRNTISFTSLVATSSDSFLRVPENMTSDSWTMLDGDVAGPFDIALAVAEDVTTDDGEAATTNIALFASTDFLYISTSSQINNGDIALNALTYMSGLSSSVSIASKSTDLTSLSFTTSDVVFSLVVFVVGIPLATLIGGFVYWLKRRSK